MLLKVIIEEQTFPLTLDPEFLQKAASFFDDMDKDMDKGWQMGREWVENPSPHQRLTIVADKLYTAIDNDEKNKGLLMAGYIKSRAPLVTVLEMDITGEMGHDFIEEEQSPVTHHSSNESLQAPLNKMQAMQQASKEVSKVFKTGKQYKFSLYNNQTQQWEESPAIADKAEAEKMREFAFKKRFDALSLPFNKER